MNQALLASLFFVLAAFSANNLSLVSMHSNDERSESLFLPKREAAELLSFGYKGALSNALWFKTVSYFGKHYRSDKDYTWLSHMCELVTDLNPNSKHVFEFGSLMLAWEAKKPREALALLDKAVQKHPSDWKFLYLRGFTKYFFFEDIQGSRDDFISAANLPGAHPVIKKIAAREMATSEGPERAIAFLKDAIQATQDPRVKEALTERLLEISRENGSKDARN